MAVVTTGAPSVPEIVAVGRSRPTLTGYVLFLILSLPFIGLAGPATEGRTPVLAAAAMALLVLLFIGIVLPLVYVRRVRASATPPRDATAGDDLTVDFRVSGVAGDVLVRALDPPGEWCRVSAGEIVPLPHHALKRGIFEVLRVEVRSTAPLGLFDARRVMDLPLEWPIAVAPSALAVSWKPGSAPLDGTAAPVRAASLGGELVRTVRAYAPGDPARLVHWPSTARTGDLVVRELEPPNPVGQVVVLDLSGLGHETEAAASYAMGACVAVLGVGGRLVVCFHDETGPRTETVSDRLGIGRLLAGAIEGSPGAAPDGWPVVEIGR